VAAVVAWVAWLVGAGCGLNSGADEWVPPSLKGFFSNSKVAQTCKIKMDAFQCSKNTQILHEAKFWNRFKFESPMNFKGVQTFWENPRNSPKFCFDLVFTTVNLVGHTCMHGI
jgi:hypothetical protein